MIMTIKSKCLQAVQKLHPEIVLKNCYEAIANGTASDQTELHGFVINDLYFVDAQTLEVFNKSDFFLVENIEEALLD